MEPTLWPFLRIPRNLLEVLKTYHYETLREIGESNKAND